ncbi:GNAT family N-acetyltransferase [Maridesulfovibrio zosterae]|uniref:GNAT family N-acetyltransferase n=1 Tax=Maridesulfovibrio zosterae TaxID=82171 RepID=UPI0003FC3B80|nr:GNAT family N-acetyltransferase [Maridesulfovibrio zosterae]
MIIRKAEHKDVNQIVHIFHETIHQINCEHYSPEQIQAWSPDYPESEKWYQKRIQAQTTFIAEKNSIILGFGEFESNGHLDCLYCHNEYIRQGIGSALLKRIEKEAFMLGMKTIYTESSITALPFFEAHDFTISKEQYVLRAGIMLKNFKMEKILTSCK